MVAQVCSALGGGPKHCQMPSKVTVNGFYDGGGVYKLRFSPPYEGSWAYTTASKVGGWCCWSTPVQLQS